MSKSPGAIQAEGLCKRYEIGGKRLDILKDASLNLEMGQSLAVVGVSGAGKSTLLHALGGLDRPDHGVVRIKGSDVYCQNESRRARLRALEIGFIFQSYFLLPEMDVLENVMLPALALPGFRRRPRDMRKRALELLKSVGLGERSAHTPLELSGGEQQRAALARALMNDPAIILADEPTGNLDEDSGGHVMDILVSLTRKGGHSLVLVTHDRSVAEMCDRTMVLCEGSLRDA